MFLQFATSLRLVETATSQQSNRVHAPQQMQLVLRAQEESNVVFLFRSPTTLELLLIELSHSQEAQKQDL